MECLRDFSIAQNVDVDCLPTCINELIRDYTGLHTRHEYQEFIVRVARLYNPRRFNPSCGGHPLRFSRDFPDWALRVMFFKARRGNNRFGRKGLVLNRMGSEFMGNWLMKSGNRLATKRLECSHRIICRFNHGMRMYFMCVEEVAFRRDIDVEEWVVGETAFDYTSRHYFRIQCVMCGRKCNPCFVSSPTEWLCDFDKTLQSTCGPCGHKCRLMPCKHPLR